MLVEVKKTIAIMSIPIIEESDMSMPEDEVGIDIPDIVEVMLPDIVMLPISILTRLYEFNMDSRL